MDNSADGVIDLTLDSDDDSAPKADSQPPRGSLHASAYRASYGLSNASKHPQLQTPRVAAPLSSNGTAANGAIVGPQPLPIFSTSSYQAADDFENARENKRRKLSILSPAPDRSTPSTKAPKTQKFYGVIGHVSGIYTDYAEVLRQVTGSKGSKQQVFKTREAAQAFVHREQLARSTASRITTSTTITQPESPYLTPSNRVSDTRQADADSARSASSPTSLPVLNRAPKPAANGKLSVQLLNRALDAAGTSKSLSIVNKRIVDEASATVPRPFKISRLPARGEPSSNSRQIADQETFAPSEHRPDSATEGVVRGDILKSGLAKDFARERLQTQTGRASLTLEEPASERPTPIASSHTDGFSPRTSAVGKEFSDIDSHNAKECTRDSTSGVGSSRSAHNESSKSLVLSNPSCWGALSEKEAHLLIFLKEVRKFRWSEITATFAEHYPGRTYTTLQSNYSTKINRRDRTEDPSILILPSFYASEAQIDWAAVSAMPTAPSNAGRRRKVDDLLPPQSPLFDSDSSSNFPRRPRRAVPVKNYKWPKSMSLEDKSDGEKDFTTSTSAAKSQSRCGGLVPDLSVATKTVSANNAPVAAQFDRDDAALAIHACNGTSTVALRRLPYLSHSQRSSLHHASGIFQWDQVISRDWQGVVIHVDFGPVELNTVESTVLRIWESSQASKSRSQRSRLRNLLSRLTEPDMLRLASALRSELRARDRQSIGAFLSDAQANMIRCSAPRIERIAAARCSTLFCSGANVSISTTIRHRELGIQSHRGWRTAGSPVSYLIKNKVQDTLGPVSSYTGASSDVHTVAWSKDGQFFAAGAICVDDPDSMQYNRSNNLLYGDFSRRTISELGKHYVDRTRPETGLNSNHAMHASQDPKLYKTVTSVAFSPSGRYMFSGGYDNNVSVWDIQSNGLPPREIISLKHKAEVETMAVNQRGILATATRKGIANSIKVIKVDDDDPCQLVKQSYSSDKATARPDLNIRPSALHFSPRYDNLLLAGFAANARADGRDQNGDICLWDINTKRPIAVGASAKNVYDVSFHPKHTWAAIACTAGHDANRGMRSCVRIYAEQEMDAKFIPRLELECKALDMNDVVWCPGDDNLVAAGCTDGRVYVWDIRNPDHLLTELSHGTSLMPLDDGVNLEIADTGVRFLSWGDNATRLYSGSSDGVVKVWNVMRSVEENFVKDLFTANSGIMSGAFSPDGSRLLLGEVNGSVNVLEVGREGYSSRDADKMKYIPFVDNDDDDKDDEALSAPCISAPTDSGIHCARELLHTGQLMYMPMGGLPKRQAVQGPAYAGPFDSSSDAPSLRRKALETQQRIYQTPTSQCSIPKCLAGTINITSEETGDSGRSTDRIPDTLRQQWKNIPSDNAVIPGKTHCSRCGRAARPSVGAEGKSILCERCSFSCFRCGTAIEVAPTTETLSCRACKHVWSIGALGYESISDNVKRSDQSIVSSLRPVIKDLVRLEVSDWSGDNTSFGDETNALTDYYLGWTIERPESPLF